MDAQILAGSSLALIGGVLQGVFALPMKFVRGWQHENTWLVFAFSGLVLFPWLLTLSTVPQAGVIYAQTAPMTIVSIIGFGVVWGIGATLTGVGLNLLGIGLGLSIILGLSASVGSLVPMLVLTPARLATRQGVLYLAGTAVMLAGIALSARAGVVRDSLLTAPQGGKRDRKSFLVGLIVCIASGVFSGSLNFSYAFGARVVTNAVALGVHPVWAPDLIAAPAITGGFVPNLLFCAYMMKAHSTTSNFWRAGSRLNWLHGSLMGAFWFGGLSFYGIGISRMGSFGTVLGWPLFTGAIILASNAAGCVTGEWRGIGKRTGAVLTAGMLLVLVAVGILSLAR